MTNTPIAATEGGLLAERLDREILGRRPGSHLTKADFALFAECRKALATRTPSPCSLGEDREVAARAVNPASFRDGDVGGIRANQRRQAYQIADRVLAALSSMRPVQEEGVGEDVFDKNSKPNRDCLAKAKPGEPMFIILGRDPDGGNIVRLWAQRRKDAGDPAHADSVFPIADAMDAWAADPANAPESAPPANAYLPLAHPEASPPSLGVEGDR